MTQTLPNGMICSLTKPSTTDPNANFINTSNFKIGKNMLSNRFIILNNKITLSSLNKSYGSFKIDCKRMFLKVLHD